MGAVKELVGRGHQVSVLTRSMPSFSVTVPVFLLKDWKWDEHLEEFACVVYTPGADGRDLDQSYEHFFEENVTKVREFLTQARDAGVQRVVLLSSYFLAFPDLMTNSHPYVKTRVLQWEETLKVCGDDVTVCLLEIPYVFGTYPAKKFVPLWKPLVEYCNTPSCLPLFFTPGGTAMSTVQDCAKIIGGAVDHGQNGKQYKVGGRNMLYKDWLQMLQRGKKKKSVVAVPFVLLVVIGFVITLFDKVVGKAKSLETFRYMWFQCSETFIDDSPTRKELQ